MKDDTPMSMAPQARPDRAPLASLLRHGWSALGPRRGPGLVLAVLTVLAGMGLLALSGWFITATALAGLVAASALVFDVFMPSAGIRLLALGRTAARYGERLLTHDAALAALARLREHLFRGLAAGAQGSGRLRYPARALFRLTADLDALESLFLRLLVPACGALGAALLAGAVLGWQAPALGALAVLWLLAVGLGTAAWLARAARAPAQRRALALERLRAQAIDLVSGQTELVMASRQGAQCAQLARADRRLARADRRLNRLDLRAGALYGVAGSLTLALALIAVAALVQAGRLDAPGAALVLLLALGAMEPFGALRRGALDAGRSWLAARRLAAPLAAAGAPAPTLAPPQEEGLALHLAGVQARHPGSRVELLQGFSLDVAAGERVALIGPSGAGKSSVLALVLGELRAQSGQLNARPHAWLGQRTDLFMGSLRENLRLAAPGAPDAVLWAALEAAGLAAEVRALPEGLDAQLGEDGLGLSGGQLRRLALARLLLQPHALWLLDEPTDALDAATAAEVLRQLDMRGQGRAWLMATHLRREAALADRLVFLRQGCVQGQWRRGEAGFATALAALRPD